MWTEQKGGQGSPKHVDRAKGWPGFTKTCGQSRRVDRVDRAKGWTGLAKHVDRAKGWAGFTKTYSSRAKEKGRQGSQKRGHSKRVDRVRQNIAEQKGRQGSPKHVDRSKGWTGLSKIWTCQNGGHGQCSAKHRQCKRVDRVRKKIDRAEGWTGFVQTCGQSKRVDRVR